MRTLREIVVAARATGESTRAEYRWYFRVTRLICVVGAWFAISFFAIIHNKMLLGSGEILPSHIAIVQTFSSVLLGALIQFMFRIRTIRGQDGLWSVLRRNVLPMVALGLMRFLVTILGLVSLKHVAASFTETVKSSGPFFTAVTAYFILNERTPARLLLTMIPVAGGLVVASITELSFTTIGFAAAISTNLVESVQNVFCKKLLSERTGETELPRFTAPQLQFYSAVSALLLQMIITSSTGAVTVPPMEQWKADPGLGHFAVNGLLFYLQSLLAYTVMLELSPVSVAVLNTSKRLLIILGCTLFFGNRVKLVTWLGTAVCLGGVCLYSLYSRRLLAEANASAWKAELQLRQICAKV